MEIECNSALEKKIHREQALCKSVLSVALPLRGLKKKFGSSLQVLGDGEEKYSSIKRI